MDPATIALISEIIQAAVKVGPPIVEAVENAIPYAEEIYAVVTGDTRTPEQVEAMRTRIKAMSSELQAIPTDDIGTG